MNCKTQKPAGFTLVELLVVVGVIAILVSLLLPALRKVRYQAQLTNCLSNLRQITAATHAYAAENDRRFPYAEREWPHASMVDIWRLLRPKYISAGAKFNICPSDYDPAFTLWWVQTHGPGYGFANPAELDYPSSYYYFFPFYHDFDCSRGVNYPGCQGPHTQMYMHQVKYPTRKAIFVCYGMRTGPLGDYRGGHNRPGYALAFVDGHVAFVNFTEMEPADTFDGTGSYNLDWTRCGLQGYDTK